ncbi:helix-turn-helix domain-containing protein [Paenibacillus physcomitrellae]|uniref:DNA-binding protein n=1 Tax=Paenibacillus physcomitrellae TaxID=1619311 RepID=A0ABQ1FU94_9BACL|nr:helix-turn-helix domain-containing protein [Paenibacillus physcomitrellae]GGA30966.1 hypothetical protein GCM10010917_15020 [Paenibacillus physcomitrellae]
MNMGITLVEKNQFSRNASGIAEELIERLSSFDNSILLFKVLALALKNNEELVQKFDESIFEDPSQFREQYLALLEHALSQAVGTSKENRPSPLLTTPIKEYTPKELSKYFGVSVPTIFKWIDQGRFEGVQRAGSNKHNHIPDYTIYTYSSGAKAAVRDIIASWEHEETERLRLVNEEDDLTYYTAQIAQFESKYNGEFERTLGTKEQLTPEEETDAQVWRHLLGRQKHGFRDSKK